MPHYCQKFQRLSNSSKKLSLFSSFWKHPRLGWCSYHTHMSQNSLRTYVWWKSLFLFLNFIQFLFLFLHILPFQIQFTLLGLPSLLLLLLRFYFKRAEETKTRLLINTTRVLLFIQFLSFIGSYISPTGS